MLLLTLCSDYMVPTTGGGTGQGSSRGRRCGCDPANPTNHDVGKSAQQERRQEGERVQIRHIPCGAAVTTITAAKATTIRKEATAKATQCGRRSRRQDNRTRRRNRQGPAGTVGLQHHAGPLTSGWCTRPGVCLARAPRGDCRGRTTDLVDPSKGTRVCWRRRRR